MHVDGRCHCGRITYEAEIDPANVRICHCTDCQALASSAFRTVVSTDEKDFHLLTGEPRIYVKTAESGRRRQQAFCPDCGTAIYATSDEPRGARRIGLRLGAVVQRDRLVPSRQFWVKSRVRWLDDLATMPADEAQ